MRKAYFFVVLLPLLFLGFQANAVKIVFYGIQSPGDEIIVNWVVEDDDDVEYYEVQRTEDGATWVTVGSVDQGDGIISGNTTRYSYTDIPENGFYFYRLRVMDKEGEEHFSSVHKGQISNSSNGGIKDGLIKLDTDQLTVVGGVESDPFLYGKFVTITDYYGRVVQKDRIAPQGDIQMNIGHLPPGNYILSYQKAGLIKSIPFYKN